ncbi:MAG: YceI family protein [Chloroflexi bacterium]|nr:YceI family protein [Chloroflexota bacterium]
MAWIIDKAHSAINFSVKHMMISTVRGSFKEFDARLDLNEQDPAHSYIEGTVNLASIDTKDPNRDGHLRSPDFFDVENHPTMTFRSKHVEVKGHDRFHVIGDLTIKGITREVVFDVTEEGRGRDPWGKEHWGFTADLVINRKDFGLNWNVALETGGWLVGEQVKVTIDLEAVNVQEQPVEQSQAETTKV